MTAPPPNQPPGHISALAGSWLLHLAAENKSPRTLQSYGESFARFTAFLEEHGMPTGIEDIRRDHVAAWIADLLERYAPATASVRFRGLQQFFRWAEDEGEVERSPCTA
jgi:site-specific recombinase XerD